MSDRPRVLLCFNSTVRASYVTDPDLDRLSQVAEWDWLPSEGAQRLGSPGSWDTANPSLDPADAKQLRERIDGYDALVVCHGAPYIDQLILDSASRLTLISDVHGDRFANRIDVAAATERGVRVVDTTHGSSPPVAEWALGHILIGLRNAGEHHRRMIAGEEYQAAHDDFGVRVGELTGRQVGIIGLGHIGRRLIELLAPFHCRILVHDPYAPKEVALAQHVQLTSLDRVMSCEVVVCAAPITPRTHRMIGARELNLIPTDGVFVNISRGAIVDPDALIARARRGDIRVGLDVFDPEPIPSESEIRRLVNVFLTPHIAGVTAACWPRYFAYTVDELERHFRGDETMFDITPRVLANRRGVNPV